MSVPYTLFSLSCALALLTAVEGYEIIGKWGDWTKCSVECGGGTQERNKYCDGNLCGRTEASCHMMPCDDPFRRLSWTDCSEPCGDDGTRSRSADTGEKQEIRCNTHSCQPTEGDCVGDVVFVLDSSGSIGAFNWSVSVQFVIDVMKGLKISSKGTHVSVVIYSTTVAKCFGLNAYNSMSDIEPVVFNLEYMAGVTNTADGIMVMHQILNDEGRGGDIATPIGVVITDGASNQDAERTLPEADLAKKDNIEMFAVAIGEAVNMDEINGIASHQDYVFRAASYRDVQRLTRAIADKICEITPRDKCDVCEDFGDCIVDKCGVEGTKEGSKYCWKILGRTRKEKEGSRHKVPCSEPCVKPCPPEKKCDVDCGNFGKCDAPCGVKGIMKGTNDCWFVDAVTGEEIPDSRQKVDCDAPCLVPCPTTTTTPWRVDCSRCDYTKGQIWLEDRYNCHLYYICEPLGNGNYRIHHVTCGELFWNQAYHTCVPVMPADADCDVGPVSLYSPEPTVNVPCPYESYPGDPSKFWISGDPLTISSCIAGMEFVNMGDLCDCIPAGPLIPECDDDLLLHFPYEDHFNDVTCHRAIATQYGTGVSLQYDAERQGKVACFTGGTHFEVAFLRTWFANNKVDKFTVSVRFKRQGEQTSPQGIVNNGDCIDTAGFLIGHADGMLMANITTDEAGAQRSVSDASADDRWYHVVWVYDGQCLMVYVDGDLKQTIPISGYLKNNDVPMYIANCCGKHFFVGCLDELRVYNRVLSQGEIQSLP